MDARLLVSSKFMVSETFGLGEIPKEPLVTIAKVTLETQEEGTEKWGLLYFKESWAKPLKVNRTHQRALMMMFGNETDGWTGKRIGLYAMAGTFFGKRQTAVRIKGSPDIKEAISFQVKKFGGGKDTYNLAAMGGGNAGAQPAPDAGLQVIFKKSPLYGRLLADLAVEELQALLVMSTEAMKADQLSTEQLSRLQANSIAMKVALDRAKARLASNGDEPGTNGPGTNG